MELLQHHKENEIFGENKSALGEYFIPLIFVLSLSLVFLTSFFFNTLFLIIYFRKSSLRNISNKFIASLTISNLATTSLLPPVLAVDYLLSENSFTESFLGPYLCNIFSAITDFVVVSTICATSLIAFDRYHAIIDPLHYHMILTKRKSIGLIIVGWVGAFSLGFLSFISSHRGTWNACEISESNLKLYVPFSTFSILNVSLCFIIPCSFLCLRYWQIYEAARGNSERARRSSVCTAVMESPKNLTRSPSLKSSNSSHLVINIRRRISNASLFLYKEEAKAAILSLVVVLLFVISWMPYFCTQIAASFLSDVYGQTTSRVHSFTIFLILCNALASSYIYVYRSERIKKEASRFLQDLCRKEPRKRKFSYHHLPNLFTKVSHDPLERECQKNGTGDSVNTYDQDLGVASLGGRDSLTLSLSSYSISSSTQSPPSPEPLCN